MKTFSMLLILLTFTIFISAKSWSKEFSNMGQMSLLELNTNIYIGTNNTMTPAYLELVYSVKNRDLQELLYNAFEFAVSNYSYRLGGRTLTWSGSKKKGYIDCTALIFYLFKETNLPVEFATTWQMVSRLPHVKENFNYIPAIPGTRNSFMPKTGDILAYYDKTRERGHAVLVIDPKKCIAINATSWVWVENAEGDIVLDRSQSGVFFQKVEKGECSDGIWKSWDSSMNRFQVMLRHKNFEVEENALSPRAKVEPMKRLPIGDLSPIVGPKRKNNKEKIEQRLIEGIREIISR